MPQSKTIAVDLAKDVYEVGFANQAHRIVKRKRLNRSAFRKLLTTEPASLVVMEACGTAHFWGRLAEQSGHRVKILPAQYVRPYRRRNKTDRADVSALVEANRCVEIKPVPVRSVEQQLAALTRDRRDVHTLTKISGIGPLTSTAMVAAAGSPHHFKSARHFASWLGLTPRESSSGNRRHLGLISK